MTVAIDCPACNMGKIMLEPAALALGAAAACSHCSAKLSIAQSDKTLFNEKLKAYETYKARLASLQQQGNRPEIV